MRHSVWLAALGLLLAAALGISGPVAAGEDEPILTISNSVVGGMAPFSLTHADLAGLPQREIRTHTAFTDGRARFRGPLVRDVIGLLPRGRATMAEMQALNDYSMVIPLSDFMRYDVILALEQDGRRLTRRDQGPIWLIYPIDDAPDLYDAGVSNKLIWQLSTITLQ